MVPSENLEVKLETLDLTSLCIILVEIEGLHFESKSSAAISSGKIPSPPPRLIHYNGPIVDYSRLVYATDILRNYLLIDWYFSVHIETIQKPTSRFWKDIKQLILFFLTYIIISH